MVRHLNSFSFFGLLEIVPFALNDITKYIRKVLIIEKRNHIAGNCCDYLLKNGILVSKYGAHLFHTNEESVWDYVNQFSEWYFWEQKECHFQNYFWWL